MRRSKAKFIIDGKGICMEFNELIDSINNILKANHRIKNDGEILFSFNIETKRIVCFEGDRIMGSFKLSNDVISLEL